MGGRPRLNTRYQRLQTFSIYCNDSSNVICDTIVSGSERSTPTLAILPANEVGSDSVYAGRPRFGQRASRAFPLAGVENSSGSLFDLHSRPQQSLSSSSMRICIYPASITGHGISDAYRSRGEVSTRLLRPLRTPTSIGLDLSAKSALLESHSYCRLEDRCLSAFAL
jgi:hypothetical protein